MGVGSKISDTTVTNVEVRITRNAAFNVHGVNFQLSIFQFFLDSYRNRHFSLNNYHLVLKNLSHYHPCPPSIAALVFQNMNGVRPLQRSKQVDNKYE